MQDITNQLTEAKILIHNTIGSHQSTPEMAVSYAVRQLGLPPSVVNDLNEYARQLAKSTRVSQN